MFLDFRSILALRKLTSNYLGMYEELKECINGHTRKDVPKDLTVKGTRAVTTAVPHGSYHMESLPVTFVSPHQEIVLLPRGIHQII
jgi:hypothetical protein